MRGPESEGGFFPPGYDPKAHREDPDDLIRDFELLQKKCPPKDEAEAFTPPSHWKRLDAADAEEWECRPLEPIIEGLVARGNLAIIAAPSQTGKSLLAANMARRLVQGGRLFDHFQIHPVRKVLYLVLEDPDRRVKERLLDFDSEFPGRPEPGRLVFYVAPGFNLSDLSMVDHLEELIRTEGFDVVFVDTYQKATPGISSFDDEQQSLILHRLSDLTRRLGVTLIVIDHLRKPGNQSRRAEAGFEDLKGTGGKMQNADAIILLERSGPRQIRLRATSKDFDEPVGILLNVSGKGSEEPKFQFTGELEEMTSGAKARGNENRDRVLQSMRVGDWYTTGELAKEIDLSLSTVRRHLAALVEAEELDEYGELRERRYCRPAQKGVMSE